MKLLMVVPVFMKVGCMSLAGRGQVVEAGANGEIISYSYYLKGGIRILHGKYVVEYPGGVVVVRKIYKHGKLVETVAGGIIGDDDL